MILNIKPWHGIIGCNTIDITAYIWVYSGLKIRKGLLRLMFSLLIGTLNRSECIKYCLESLRNQTYKDFEVIIIDQSKDDLTEKVLENFRDLTIVYERVAFKGLSKARNEAIRLAKGDYFCLIDDDAYYSEDYLSNIEKHITNDRKTIITGYLWNCDTKSEFVSYNALTDGKKLSHRQVIRYCPSPALSFPKEIISESGDFDKEFGVGAKYGAGEETDFILRAMRHGCAVRYYSDVKAQHPHEKLAKSVQAADVKKLLPYNFGIGAMYEKQFCLGNGFSVLFPYIEKIIKLKVKCLLYRKEEFVKEKEAFWQGKKEYKREQPHKENI